MACQPGQGGRWSAVLLATNPHYAARTTAKCSTCRTGSLRTLYGVSRRGLGYVCLCYLHPCLRLAGLPAVPRGGSCWVSRTYCAHSCQRNKQCLNNTCSAHQFPHKWVGCGLNAPSVLQLVSCAAAPAWFCRTCFCFISWLCLPAG